MTDDRRLSNDERTRELARAVAGTPDDGQAWDRLVAMTGRIGEPPPYEAVRARLAWLADRVEVPGLLATIRETTRLVSRARGRERPPWRIILARKVEEIPVSDRPNSNEVEAGITSSGVVTSARLVSNLMNVSDDAAIPDWLGMELHNLAYAAFRRAGMPQGMGAYATQTLGVVYQPPMSGTFPRGSLMTGAQARIFAANMVDPAHPRFMTAAMRPPRPDSFVFPLVDGMTEIETSCVQIVVVTDVLDAVELRFVEPRRLRREFKVNSCPSAWLAVFASLRPSESISMVPEAATKFLAEN